MGSKKGDVKGRRKVRRSQVVEGIGSPHWTISATGSSVMQRELFDS
jgi:hypothetical protein